jgi:hypothetical protein
MKREALHKNPEYLWKTTILHKKADGGGRTLFGVEAFQQRDVITRFERGV